MAARAKLVGRGLAVALVAALLGLLGWKVAHGSGKTAQPKNFTLERVNGTGTLQLASLRGKVVVLNFWASWCNPCKQEARIIEAAWRRYRSRGVVVVGVDSKDFAGDARSFMRRYGITYPVVRDGDGSLWGPYGVTGLPETRFIGRDGKYVGSQIDGPVTEQVLRAGIERALRT
ncbi:MAG TPA: TlpA disulfide reductase family protein [Gaiellaceae bacterium]|nr:TlpA disulfide reductase family protein [Gaiellaceae bacterium]